MKLARSVIFSSYIALAGAFAPDMMRRSLREVSSTGTTIRHMTAGSLDPDQDGFGSAMPISTAYDRIGITEDQLALGVDATEFLQWIGSKQELVNKFSRDNKGMSEERANAEVSKFMMDAEMVNAYIKFERNKVENPPDRKAEAEQTLSDPKTIATYAAWLIGGGSFGYIRKNFIEPKYASGEWEEFHIQLPTPPGFGTSEVVDAAQSVASVVEQTVDQSVVTDLDNVLSAVL